MSVEAESGGLGGVLPSEISRGVLLVLVSLSGGISPLLVENGEDLGDGLSNNLYKNVKRLNTISRVYTPKSNPISVSSTVCPLSTSSMTGPT